MASTVLPNGIIIPEKFSRDWYADLYHNWQELDNLLGGGGANDGTLTIQKNGTTVGTFSANQATDETVNITVPDVNDATLTIQQNGTTVDTFTANSSTDKTVDITVPTKTSDLTNDSGFITEDTTKIPLAGSNQISGSLIPATTDAYDLGGTSYQWNNAYIKSLTINGVACGDILTHNASEFVNVTGAQTIGGTKTFSDGINNKNVQQFIFNKEYNDATDSWLDIHRYLDKNSTRIGFYSIGDFSGNRSFRWFVRGQSTNSAEVDIFGFGRKINETSYMYINATLETDLIPTNNNSKSLGSSTNKWKTINGINPGALSLPSTNLINVASSITALDGTTINKFTPQVNGWLLINGTGTANDGFIYAVQGQIGMMSANNTIMLRCAVLIPVVAGVEVSITCKLNTLTWANIAPCQGNV